MIEYHVEATHGYPINNERLNQLGAENWQLIMFIQDVAYFSRAKVEQPKPDPTPKQTRKRAVKK